MPKKLWVLKRHLLRIRRKSCLNVLREILLQLLMSADILSARA